MKNVSIKTRLIGGFAILDVLMIICLYFGYSTANNLAGGNVENPQHFMRSYQIFDIVLFVVMIGIMTFICVGLVHRIDQSIEMMINASKKLAVGDVDVNLNREGNDEFSKMIVEYQKVIDNIRYQADIAEKVADGDMTVSVTPKSERDIMGKALQKLVKQNRDALLHIEDAACQVNTSSSQVASASEALAQGSTEQASAIEEITASIDDIAEKTKENAAEADKAAELMDHAIVNVDKGKQDMTEMMDAMQQINASSESISKIIKVIDDIAFQTNILALNAAVEAARAGEAGKGFAVVAEEVRNLAAKSAAAASETAELIEDSIEKVETGSKIAQETEKAIDAITEVVTESGKIVEGIAQASNYQATAIAQVDQAIGQVSQVVQNNSATSEECAAASIELSNQSVRMTELLSIFTLDSRQNGLQNRQSEYSSKAERNEQIISLGNGFGKY